MRFARFGHHNAVKGGEDWSYILACPNERCRDYVKPALWGRCAKVEETA
jgi:hypothetical protein